MHVVVVNTTNYHEANKINNYTKLTKVIHEIGNVAAPSILKLTRRRSTVTIFKYVISSILPPISKNQNK